MTERRRRTQEERSAATREALLAAAIAELHEHGYGATSTIVIAQKAGLSRGAMGHQFRSGADLMVFVVEEVYRRELSEYPKLLEGIDDPHERLLAYPQAAWQIMSRPSGVAVLEILQGSRSDAVLAEKLRPVLARFEREALGQLEEDLGRAPLPRLMRLITWAIRGLSIANVLADDKGEAAESIQMLRLMISASLETGALEPPIDRQR